MPPSKHMRAWVDRLLDGEEGSRVVAEMREHYSTDCSLLSRISEAKRFFMTFTPSPTQSNRHPTLAASVADLKREAERLGDSHPCSAMIRDFVDADLRTMYAEWRRRPHLKPGCVHTEAVQSIFKKMRVLPNNMDSFRAQTATLHECIAEAEEARLAKSENMSVVPSADEILALAKSILEAPASRTLSELLVALCIASGRRFGEIASPRSRFWSMTPAYAHGVMFSGQLKQRTLQPKPPYAIPLVGASATQFLAGVANLRKRQDPDLARKSQSQITARYLSNARKYQKTEIPTIRHIHELRAFYAACVLKAFQWNRVNDPRVLMYILGHQTTDFYSNYNSVKIGGFTTFYGTFPVSITSHPSREGRMSLRQRKRAGL